MTTDIYDLIIIGAGPTGISIAIEAKSAGLRYMVIEKGVLTNSIYHFPANMTFFSTSQKLEIADTPFISHSDKPTRREALEYYRRIVLADELSIRYYETVDRIDTVDDTHQVITDRGAYVSSNVAVATGFYDTPNLLNIPGEDLDKVRHYYDDAHPYVGQKVVIVGCGNSGCDTALETWSKGADVTMVIREKEISPRVKYWIRPNIINRIKEGAIKAHFGAELTEIAEDYVIMRDDEGQTHQLENDFVLAMTGYRPDYDLLRRLGVPIEKSIYRIPRHDHDTLETSTRGLYVAGVINAGTRSSQLFIENTRQHGRMIVSHILSKGN